MKIYHYVLLFLILIFMAIGAIFFVAKHIDINEDGFNNYMNTPINKDTLNPDYYLITPENFTVEEYLNNGSFSAISEENRKKIKNDFLALNKVEQQKCLSILFALQPYRQKVGFNIHVTSGFRSIRYELDRGRSGKSMHTRYGVDITCETKEQVKELAEFLERTWVGGFKHYEDMNIIHVDLGRDRTW